MNIFRISGSFSRDFPPSTMKHPPFEAICGAFATCKMNFEKIGLFGGGSCDAKSIPRTVSCCLVVLPLIVTSNLLICFRFSKHRSAPTEAHLSVGLTYERFLPCFNLFLLSCSRTR